MAGESDSTRAVSKTVRAVVFMAIFLKRDQKNKAISKTGFVRYHTPSWSSFFVGEVLACLYCMTRRMTINPLIQAGTREIGVLTNAHNVRMIAPSEHKTIPAHRALLLGAPE